jgi:NADH:ubiquinone oxidoreductase subunit 6 (subunit J)/NAD-dependent dihydropyrimidine dehydrogenase PreA subunit
MVKVNEQWKHNKKSIMPQIDYGKCVFCGLCVDACPFYALYMTNDYELSSFTKEHLIYTPAQLGLKPKYDGDVVLLDAQFVAMFQITVYVGAVAVLVIFTVMLVRTQDLFSAKDDKGRKAGGIILALVTMGGIGAIFLVSGINNPMFGNPDSSPIDIKEIGKTMLTYYSPALIVLGLTLAGAVIGALALARREGLLKENESAN